MSPAAWTAAQPVAGYSLRERIGAGGYGEVWKADAPGGLVKAIKFVYGHFDEERAACELKSLNRIKEVRHPFLLSLERIEVIDSQLVIVTELADSSLKDRCEECRAAGQPGIPRGELLGYLRDAADALDYLGQRFGLQHLDIKPENLLLLGGHVKVGDFGLVREVQDRTVSLLGGLTPSYAPPEVFDGRPGLFSDQYSLAIVYQEMLTGELPFPGRTAIQLAAQHAHAQPCLASLRAEDRDIVGRALAKDPEQRHPSCRALVEELFAVDIVRPGMSAASRPDSAADTATYSETHTEPAHPQPGRCRPDEPTLPPRPSDVPAPQKTCVLDEDAWSHAHQAGSLAGLEWLAPPDLAPPDLAPMEPDVAGQATVVDLPPLVLEKSDVRFRPTLIVGLGGLAAGALLQLRRRLNDCAAPGSLPAIQFLLIDTDRRTLVEATRESNGAALEHRETLALPLRSSQDYRSDAARHLRWIDRRWLYNVPRSLRTEGLRPLGRLALVDRAEEVRTRLRTLINTLRNPEALAATSRRLGLAARPDFPRIYVLAGIGGGSGGGMLIDMAYLIREVLGEFDLSDEGLCGMLVHAVGRGAGADIGRANAYACLRELNHFSRAAAYPGEPECGLAPAPRGTAPFRETYLLDWSHLASDREFVAAGEDLAEYLFQDVAGRSGTFFDRCRQAAYEATLPHEPVLKLRSFAIRSLGSVSGRDTAVAADAICRHLVRQWLGIPETAAASPQAAVPAGGLTTLRFLDAAPAGADRQREQEAMESLHLDLDALLETAGAIIQHHLSQPVESYFNKRITEHLSPNAPGDPAQRMDALRNEIHQIVGWQQTSETEPAPGDSIQAELDAQFETLGRSQSETLLRWIVGLLDEGPGRSQDAHGAAGWFSARLHGIESEARTRIQRLQQGLEAIVAAIAASNRPAESRLRLFRSSRAAANPSLEAAWLAYARNQLDQALLRSVASLARNIRAPVAALNDRLGEFRMELNRVADLFGSAAPPAAPTGDEPVSEAQGILAPLWARIPGMAAELQKRWATRSESAGYPLRGLFLREDPWRVEVTGELRATARALVRDSVRELAAGTAQAARPVPDDASCAVPLLACGGARRVLVVGPDRETADRLAVPWLAAAIPPSVAVDSESLPVVCCEAGQISLSAAAAQIVEKRPDLVAAAARLNTRLDVRWSSLPPR